MAAGAFALILGAGLIVLGFYTGLVLSRYGAPSSSYFGGFFFTVIGILLAAAGAAVLAYGIGTKS